MQVKQPVKEPVKQSVKETENDGVKETSKDVNKQVSMIEAIKHLIAENKIPLSTSKTVAFTYVAKTSADYPYMKTALEKRMIGATTNPDMIISCDVYMVMKGLAQGWAIPKTADVKLDYWNVATAKDVLNGCVKGAKLTYANL